MSESQLRHDLSRNLQNRLSDTLQRELKIAGHALDSADIGSLLFNAAVMMMRSAAATIGAMAEPPHTPGEVYELTIDCICKAERVGRAAAIKRAVDRAGWPI